MAAVGSAMLIAVSACGQSQQPAAESLGAVRLSAAETLQKSAQNSESVTSYTAQLAVDFSSAKQGAGTVKGTMVYHQKPQIATDVTLDQIDVAGQNVPGGVRVILIGQTAYLKIDALSKLVGGGKPWIKVDLAKASESAGVDLGQFLSQAQQMDLQSSVKMLTSSKDVSKVGTETVGGAETTHYKGTFKVADAVKQLTPELQQKLQGQLTHVQDMKFDAWIDAQNLPRKVDMNGAAGDGTFRMTSTFGQFNEAAEVSPPPADQVGDLSDKMGRLQSPEGTGTTS